MTDRKYTLSDFADGVDIDHPLAARRIPVIENLPAWFKFHIALVIGGRDWMPIKGLEPEDWEVEQLLVFLEKTMRYYTDSYRRQVEEKAPFDVDGTVNTTTFRKTKEYGWQYNRATWDHAVFWPSPISEPGVGPFTLERLLDYVNTVGDGAPMQVWLDLKKESGKFGVTEEPEPEPEPDPVPTVKELMAQPRPRLRCNGCEFEATANRLGLAEALHHDMVDVCRKRGDANADGWSLNPQHETTKEQSNEGRSDHGEHHPVPAGGADQEQQ